MRDRQLRCTRLHPIYIVNLYINSIMYCEKCTFVVDYHYKAHVDLCTVANTDLYYTASDARKTCLSDAHDFNLKSKMMEECQTFSFAKIQQYTDEITNNSDW